MIALGLKLLGIGKWLKEALKAAFRWALAHPWQTATIALLCASAILWRGWNHAEAQRDTWKRAYTAQKAASDLAAEAQKALNAKTQRTYEEQANVAQERYDALADRSGDLTRDYIAAHRLRAEGGQACRSDPAAASGGAAVSQVAPAEPELVAVSADDVTVCAANHAYARSAYEWAQGLIGEGVAK